jgi:hypothetical protein
MVAALSAVATARATWLLLNLLLIGEDTSAGVRWRMKSTQRFVAVECDRRMKEA